MVESERAQASPPADRLDSWKEIAGYLRRGVSTVQRWERGEGLPVRRLPHAKAGSVFAYPRELDSWLRKRSEGRRGPEGGAAPSASRGCRLAWGETEFVLGEGSNLLGRSVDAEIRLAQSRVSRQHARITLFRGVATLEDLGSKNGTYLQGSRVQGPRVLRDRDEIQVGSVRLVFRALSDAGSTETGSSA